jgi:site-specific DNA recombinase
MAKPILPKNVAVFYLRMSDDRQERSIGDQRTELVAYAKKHGYIVLREYTDPGISGDDTKRRKGFLQMRDDAAKGEFSVVLCWDQDRFGRFDPIEGGYWILPFREAGVRLETIAQGKIDWNDFAGRLLYLVQQEAKHEYLKDLSRNVIRGALAAAKEGRGTGGRPPIGYKVKNGEVVVVEEEAAVRRRIFHEYLKPGAGLRTVANILNSEGFSSARGGHWSVTTIRDVLTNEKYTGAFVWGKYCTGRYHMVRDGEIIPRRKNDGKMKGTPIILRDKYPPIIDRETFDLVQQKLALQQKRTAPKSRRLYILSGLLYCGDCGTRMTAKQGKYVCRSYFQKGASVCFSNQIAEKPLVEMIVQLIQDNYLSKDARGRLCRKVKQLQEEYSHKTNPLDIDRLKRRIADFDHKIDAGAKRIFSAPEGLAEKLYATLAEFQEHRKQLEDELNALQNAENETSDEVEVEEIIEAMQNLGQAFRHAQPSDVQALVYSLISRINLKFSHEKHGSLIFNKLNSGIIHLRPDKRLSHLFGTVRRR